ncbi:MAG: hypothetical protein LBL79_12610 [Prevotella sp.]|nr:hypothetical protein [Prevotella sp.]
MKLKIEAEGFEPLYKNLNKVNDKTKDIVYSFKDVSESFKSVLTPASQSLKTLDELMTASVKHIIPNMEKISRLNDKILGAEQELNVLKTKNLKVEIAGLDKKKTAITKIYEEYDKEEKIILEKGRKRQGEQLKNIDNLILHHKTAGEDIRELEEKRAEFVKNSDKAILDAVKANSEKRKEAVTLAVKENLNSMKQMYEGQKALIVQAWELEKKKIELANDAAMEQAKTDEERVFLEERKAEKIKDINNDMNNKLAENSKSQLVATTTFVDDAIKEITDRVAETKKDKHGITDIAITKEGIAAAKAQLGEYKGMLNDSQNAAQLHFAILESQYKNDASMLKQIQDEKVNTMSMYASEIAKIEKAITETSKKENGLRMEQMKDFAKNTEEITNSMKEAVGKATDYLSTAFTTVSNVYKEEIASIDEEIKQFAAKKAEADNIATNSSKYLENLKAEQTKAQTEGNIELVNSLQERINKESDLYNTAVADQRSYAIKEEELKREKLKKQAEQEKIEKLNRKATLLKNIGESTANVAQGVTKALSYGPILGPILAAIVAAAGVVQIGIMTKQLAKFADGGLLNGKRHSQGGMRIEGTNMEVEGGEYVINRETTNKNLGLIRYINSQRKELTSTDMAGFFTKTSQGYEPLFRKYFETGGQLPAIDTNILNPDNDAIVKAIKSIKIEPQVAVSDIYRVQDTMVSVDGWTGV